MRSQSANDVLTKPVEFDWFKPLEVRYVKGLDYGFDFPGFCGHQQSIPAKEET